MDEETPLMMMIRPASDGGGDNHPHPSSSNHVQISSSSSSTTRVGLLLLGGWILGAATAYIAMERPFDEWKKNDAPFSKTEEASLSTATAADINISLLQKKKTTFKEEGVVDNDSTSSNYDAPPPSQQDWCMAEGSYDFFGTYRSPNNRAEEGLFYAPGRFQGTLLTSQNNDNVYFHIVNITYGNTLSPHHHIPNDNDNDGEYDMFDTYCTMHPVKKSACYSPKFFPTPHFTDDYGDDKKKKHHHKTRCAKLEFPSMSGFALCRQLAMAEFKYIGNTTLAPNTPVEEWTARLDTNGNPPNDYNGQLTLYMQTVFPDYGGGSSDDGGKLKKKIPLTHWLTSDDQSLEASFQVMNWKPWTNPESFLPDNDIPPGCEHAIDITKIHSSSTFNNKDNKKLFAAANSNRDGRIACPAGAIHRNMIFPSMLQHLKKTL